LALTPGSRLGVYAITAQIGEGGMGQVYRATDTTLGRQVAIKILPDGLASDPERLARFEREAKTLASLNHPHIAAIFAVETSAGLHALVMELVEGEDLSQRIARGAIPFDEALPIATQIADALEAAHEQGIVHRDLKPANIKVREDGVVKVLDFGLAKLVEAPGAGSSAAALSRSPTITSPAMMTGIGIILGTAAYMSPEQARGKVVDKRADIWAFGCVVFEMLTGQRVFEGELISDVLASVLKTDPNWQALPADTPVGVRRLLRRCLEKDPRRRLQAIGEARVQIEDLLSGAPDATVAPTPSPSRVLPLWQRALPWASTGTLAAGLAVMLVLWAPWRPAASPPRVMRTTITPTSPAALTIERLGRDLAVSPDGTHVVYVGNGSTQLFVRALDALEPAAIANGRVLRGPFVSPDGQWVGFLNNVGDLTKVSITGGPPITLARLNAGARGATWAPDDTIIFATSDPMTGLQRVSAAGGTPEVLTRPDHAQGEAGHFWPEILPGGHAVLFTITSQTGGLETAQVAVRDLRTGAQKVLLRGGSHGHYVASGHLVYVAGGTLRAIAFDLTRLETRGTSVTAIQRLATKDTGTADFAVATDGTLVYVDAPSSLAANARTLVWVDRSGKEEPIAAEPHAYMHPRVSPDGTRIAVYSLDQQEDIWIWDLGRAQLTRLTHDPGTDWNPLWTPDSQRIVFSSNRGGPFNLWWQAADGTGDAERLTTARNVQFASGITPDGTAALYSEATPTMGPDLLQVALDGTHRVTPLVQTRFDERNGIISPDGRWLAYQSDSSGPIEIYVQPFPNVDGGGQRQVSTAGGTQPLWSRKTKELFYVGANGTLMGVSVEAIGVTWNNGRPTKLLEARYLTASGANGGRTYDASPDGKRFLMIKGPSTDTAATPPAVILVQHWDEELKRLVPTK
jgi:eukaryotic-like serine/threonine-protein kinase